MERLTTLGIAVNLVTYLTGTMHLGNAASANVVTNFLGTSFMLCLLGGFLADTFLGRSDISIIFYFIQFMLLCRHHCICLVSVFIGFFVFFSPQIPHHRHLRSRSSNCKNHRSQLSYSNHNLIRCSSLAFHFENMCNK